MASTFISISPSATQYSSELLGFIRQLRDVVEKSAELKAKYDQMAMAGDYASLAAYLDLSEADALAVYNLFGSVNTDLQGAFIAQLLARCG